MNLKGNMCIVQKRCKTPFKSIADPPQRVFCMICTDPARKSHTSFCLVFLELFLFWKFPLSIMWRLFWASLQILKGIQSCTIRGKWIAIPLLLGRRTYVRTHRIEKGLLQVLKTPTIRPNELQCSSWTRYSASRRYF